MFPWLVMAALALGCLLAAKRLIHYFQLESYQHPGYFRTLRRNLLKAVLPGLMMFAVWTVSAALLGPALSPVGSLGSLGTVSSLGSLVRRRVLGRAIFSRFCCNFFGSFSHNLFNCFFSSSYFNGSLFGWCFGLYDLVFFYFHLLLRSAV